MDKTPISSSSAASPPEWTPHLPRARWHRNDFFLLAYIPIIVLIAWCLPERLWAVTCRRLLRLSMALHGSRTRGYYQKFGEILGGRGATLDVKEITVSYLTNNHLARVQGMQCLAPGGWSPPIRLEGQEHLERALTLGKGVILWIAPMASKDLITKMAFRNAGCPVFHLSRFDHGFSTSLWGARVFNPLWTRVEERYLAERLVISPTTQVTPLRGLIKRLRANHVVSLTANHEGVKYPIPRPFLSGTIQLAEGAPALSVTTGAALLPVFTVREPDGTFVTRIETALDADAPQTRAQRIDSLTAQFIQRLEYYVLHHPYDFQGWELCDE